MYSRASIVWTPDNPVNVVICTLIKRTRFWNENEKYYLGKNCRLLYLVLHIIININICNLKCNKYKNSEIKNKIVVIWVSNFEKPPVIRTMLGLNLSGLSSLYCSIKNISQYPNFHVFKLAVFQFVLIVEVLLETHIGILYHVNVLLMGYKTQPAYLVFCTLNNCKIEYNFWNHLWFCCICVRHK